MGFCVFGPPGFDPTSSKSRPDGILCFWATGFRPHKLKIASGWDFVFLGHRVSTPQAQNRVWMGFCVFGKCFQGVPNILILTFGFMTFHFDFWFYDFSF
jgi:hypothetical protein